MLEAYSKLSDLNATDSEYLNRMEIFNGYLTDTTLTEEEIEASIFEMNDYFNYFVSDTIAKIDFVPKTSITLESQLVMNVYIPIKSTQSFTLDGVTYDDFANISKIVVDGKEYYHMTVSLPSSEAAREFKLVAVVKADNGVSATATFTLSIPRYASKILANGDTSNVEQTLVRDVLQYIKSAYIYFGSTDSDALATIDTLLGTYVSSPKIEGNYSTSYVGLKGATFVLNEKPVIRFYLSDGADARDYRFYIDGKNVSFKASSDGTYVDIDVYAYALSETVTYTVKGIEGGNYHIRSYYEYVSGTGENDYNGTDKEALIALTSSFWKYVQSAADYRDAAIGVEN
jgi:hypothetical protein